MPTHRTRRPPPGVPKAEPWKPPDWSPEDAYAVQAMMRGTATEAQQQRGMHFIVYDLCATYDLSYRSEKPYDTAFAEGKRFVGTQLVKFANLNVARVLKRGPTEQGSAPREPTE